MENFLAAKVELSKTFGTPTGVRPVRKVSSRFLLELILWRNLQMVGIYMR